MIDSSMKRGAFPPDPEQRAEFAVGVLTSDREPGAVFNARVRMVLFLDFEQALELQRCLVEAMQKKLVGNELLQVELEPGVLDLITSRERWASGGEPPP